MIGKRIEEEPEESWNKKRVGITLIVLLLIAAGLIYLYKDSFNFTKPRQIQNTRVLSATDKNLEGFVQRQVQSLKNQAQHIDVGEIASSSPQVRRLIDDLKSLQNLPKDQ